MKTPTKQVERILVRLRKLCFAYPQTSERLSHGEPTFFVGAKAGKGGKVFVMFSNDHHGDGRIGIWVPAPPGAQELYVDTDPDRFFRPPYVGPSGWVGMILTGGLDWDSVAGVIDDAWHLVAPKRLVAEWDARSTRG